MRYDLCLPWYWEYDDVFVGMVERACIEEGISLWQIKPDNLLESITALYKGITTFRTLLHRGQGEAIFDPMLGAGIWRAQDQPSGNFSVVGR
jgi:hypothetical protein